MSQTYASMNGAGVPLQGGLSPGQHVRIKHYSVIVIRHLSQGGFSHVYLVCTPHPINGTTQHVLKHMTISDPAMLQEVQKEIEVMKVLQGHPNHVNLFDAAIHALPDGKSHEVFILMEYCAGGGVIDLMNRCLVDRLSEQAVMQIFVDVCEAVVYMHNFDPPILHRDLKVENILQAGDTSFKLCDYGSAATAATRPPSDAEGIRALTNDINRHTTLQYRSPEMVDPYLRRPIDEKSDVWALGVLLYKLCYYSTPFEGRGPLAILSVSYTIPTYPLYSSNITGLIGSMLMDHGASRPTAMEVLNSVHRIRGTRSPFSFRLHQRHHLNIPMPRPVSSVSPMPSPQPFPNSSSSMLFNPTPATGSSYGMVAAQQSSSSSMYIPQVIASALPISSQQQQQQPQQQRPTIYIEGIPPPPEAMYPSPFTPFPMIVQTPTPTKSPVYHSMSLPQDLSLRSSSGVFDNCHPLNMARHILAPPPQIPPPQLQQPPTRTWAPAFTKSMSHLPALDEQQQHPTYAQHGLRYLPVMETRPPMWTGGSSSGYYTSSSSNSSEEASPMSMSRSSSRSGGRRSAGDESALRGRPSLLRKPPPMTGMDGGKPFMPRRPHSHTH